MTDEPQDRPRRLADALRANLRKRRWQAKRRGDNVVPTPPAGGDTAPTAPPGDRGRDGSGVDGGGGDGGGGFGDGGGGGGGD